MLYNVVYTIPDIFVVWLSLSYSLEIYGSGFANRDWRNVWVSCDQVGVIGLVIQTR